MALQTTEKICDICSKVFSCNAAAIASCACSTVTVSPQTRLYLQANYADCICPDCLRRINAQVNAGELFSG